MEFVLAGKKGAMALYGISKETLMASPSFDFMVYRFDRWDEVLEDLGEWDDYITIDGETYTDLYQNLCIKFRELMKYL